jgi:hypothetical protein
MLRCLFLSIFSIPLVCLSSSLAIAAYDCDRLLTRPDGKRVSLMWSQPQGTQGQLGALCLTRIPMVKEKYFDGKIVNGVWTVTQTAVSATVKPQIASPHYVINIEAWSLAPSLPESTRLANIARYVQVIKAAVATTPKSKVGIYGVAPYRNWFSAISGDPGRLAQMQPLARPRSIPASTCPFRQRQNPRSLSIDFMPGSTSPRRAASLVPSPSIR